MADGSCSHYLGRSAADFEDRPVMQPGDGLLGSATVAEPSEVYVYQRACDSHLWSVSGAPRVSLHTTILYANAFGRALFPATLTSGFRWQQHPITVTVGFMARRGLLAD